jgi:geranylgeranyl diphosphate synthase type II
MTSTKEKPANAADLLSRHGDRLHEYFVKIRARHVAAPERLVESIQYSLLAGGKRLRPTLILECCNACLKKPDARKLASALASAAAMEFVHTFSLVHDDLPAMGDGDPSRRCDGHHGV